MRAKIAFTICLLSTCQLISCSRHTSDRALITLFRRERESFQRAVQLVKLHPELTFVAPDVILADSGTVYLTDPYAYRKVLTDSEWKDYQELFTQLQLRDGIKSTPKGSVYFPVDRASIANGDSEKGIVYSERSLAPLEDELNIESVHSNVAYKRLEDGWYLYLSVG